jgi:HSP20 family protein
MAKKESKKKKKLSVKPKKKEKMEIKERRPYEITTDLDRIFDSFRSNLDDLFWSPYRGLTLSEFRTPSTDIIDHGDKFEVCAEMPGIPKENINIEVTPKNIEISADYEESEEEEKKNWLRRERSSMSYYRNFDLPEEIKSDKVDAELKEGVLTVKLPKVEPKTKGESKTVKVK